MLGTEHHTLVCHAEDIAQAFPDVIWHAETPLLRTAPAPLYRLAGLVRDHGFKVVLTGEGADEFLVGYEIFQETAVRAFWARQPDSRLRPLLLRRLYGYIPEIGQTSQSYLEAFFGLGLDQPDSRTFSHLVRWSNTARIVRRHCAACSCATWSTPRPTSRCTSGRCRVSPDPFAPANRLGNRPRGMGRAA